MRKITDAIRGRLGPVGLSLLAAAVTAVAFAAISVAKDDGDGVNQGDRGERSELRGSRGPMLEGLSDADRQQLEAFRQCMENEGAPAPPRFGEGDRPPEPPSEEEVERIREAHEACQDELPEELRNRGFPPRLGHGPCGPPPGGERDDGDRGQREDGESEGDNQEQGYVVPAPALPDSATS